MHKIVLFGRKELKFIFSDDVKYCYHVRYITFYDNTDSLTFDTIWLKYEVLCLAPFRETSQICWSLVPSSPDNLHSLYLSGSIGVTDKQIDEWNVNPPLLHLWSCADWTAKDTAIAQQHGHLSMLRSEPQMENVADFPWEDHECNLENSTMNDDHAQNEEPDGRALHVIETGKEILGRDETKIHNINSNNRSYKKKGS